MSETSDGPVIRLNDIKKSFGRVQALDGVTLEVQPGIVGLLGPNGAGKSTLLRILLGLEDPTSGQAKIFGADVTRRPLTVRARTGYFPEDDCHVPGLSAVEYVAFCGELSGLPPRAALSRAHETLDYVGMNEERYRPVESYSVGMRQRIKLAQALVHDPELLLLDEPTNGMDPGGRDEMLVLIRDIVEQAKINVLLSSHLLHDVEVVCRRVIVLGHGKVRLQGHLDELARTRDNAFDLRLKGDSKDFLQALEQLGGRWREAPGGLLRVMLPPDVPALRLIELANQRKLQVRHMAPGHNTLEDVFLQALEEE